MSEEIRDALRMLDGPAEPPAGFADALFDVLVEEARRGEEPAIVGAAERSRREAAGQRLLPWQRRVGWAVAVAAVVVVALVMTTVVDISKPPSAYAVMEEARQRFAQVPPFTAVTFRRTPGAMVGDDYGRDDLPDLEVVHRVQYQDDSHWRTTVVSSSYDPAPAGFESFNGGERRGDYTVSDGTYIAHNVATQHRLDVQPYVELPRSDRRARATGDLDPGLYGFNVPAEMLRQGCKVAADTTWIGRRARRLDCYRTDTHAVYARVWLDRESGLVLRLEAPSDDRGRPYRQPFVFEVRSLKIGAAIDRSTFSTAAPAGTKVVWRGSGPPPAQFAPAAPAGSVTTIPVTRSTLSVAADDRGAYVLGRPVGPDETSGPSTLSFVDARTNRVGWTVDVRDYGSVAVAGNVVLVGGSHFKNGPSDRAFAYVDRYDARTGQKLEPSIEVPDGGNGGAFVVSNGSDVWFTGGPGHAVAVNGQRNMAPSLVRVDPLTGSTGAVVPIDLGSIVAAAIDGGRVWVAGYGLDNARTEPTHPNMDLLGFDAATGAPAKHTRFHFQLNGFLVREGVMWATAAQLDEHAPSVVRAVDIASGSELASIEVGHASVDVVEAAGSLYVNAQEDATVVRIDPATSKVVERIAAGDAPTHIAVGARSLWVTSYRAGTVARIAT